MSLTWDLDINVRGTPGVTAASRALKDLETRLLALRGGIDAAANGLAKTGASASTAAPKVDKLTKAVNEVILPFRGLPGVFKNPWKGIGDSADIARGKVEKLAAANRIVTGAWQGPIPPAFRSPAADLYGSRFFGGGGGVFPPGAQALSPSGRPRHIGMQLAPQDQFAPAPLEARVVRPPGSGGIGLGTAYLALRAFNMLASGARTAAEGLEQFYAVSIRQTELRQGQIQNLETLLGNKAAAESFFRTVNQISDIGPFKREQIQPAAARFIGQGLDTRTTAILTLALQDLTAGNVDPRAFTKAADVVSRVLAGGSLQGRSIAVFDKATSGVGSSVSLLKSIATSLKITEQQAQAGLNSPSLRGRYLLEGIRQRAIEVSAAAGGPLGTRGEQRGIYSLTGELRTLQNNAASAFATIEREPLTSFLFRLNRQMGEGTVAMDRFRLAADSAFNGILRPWIQDYRGAAGGKNAARDLGLINDAAQTFADISSLISLKIHNVGKAFKFTADVLDGLLTSLPVVGPLFRGLFEHPLDGATGLQEVRLRNVQEKLFRSIIAQHPEQYEPGFVGPPQFVLPPSFDYLRSDIRVGRNGGGEGDEEGSGEREGVVSLPHAARGAFIDRPARVNVGEGSRREVILPLDDASPFLARAMRDAGGGGSGVVHIDIGGITIEMNGVTAPDPEAIAMQVLRAVNAKLQSQFDRTSLTLTGR